MRADAHIHLFENGWTGRFGCSPSPRPELEYYEDLRSAHDITLALVVGYEGDAAFEGNNAWILRAARERSWIRPLAHVTRACSGDDVARLLDQGFVGVSVYPEDDAPPPEWDTWLGEVLTRCDRARALVSLNLGPRYYEGVQRSLGDLDGCRVLFSHLGLPGTVSASEFESLRDASSPLWEAPHVAVKLSGLYAVEQPGHRYPHPRATRIAREWIDRLGAERMCWGSDFAPALDDVTFPQTVDLPILDELDETDRRIITGANLTCWLEAQA